MMKEASSREILLKAAQETLHETYSLKALIQVHQELYGLVWKQITKQQRKERDQITISRIMHNVAIQEQADQAQAQKITTQHAHSIIENSILESLGTLVLHYIIRLQIADDHSHFIISTIYKPMLVAIQRLFKLEASQKKLEYELSNNDQDTLKVNQKKN